MSENENQGGQFALERIYVKDLSFEVPSSKVFLGEWKPEMNVNLNTETQRIGDSHFEVSLTVTVTANNNGTAAFVAEAKQAGIFMVEGIPEPQLSQLLGAYCPNILFPYVREAISDIVTKGSFPQLLLAPVNFDALYAESVRQREQQQAGGNAPLQ